MKKFWYFVALIVTENWTSSYDGYVMHNDGLFPINAAKLQTVDYAEIPSGDIPVKAQGDKKFFLKDTYIINQIEVSEKDFEAWKVTMKF